MDAQRTIDIMREPSPIVVSINISPGGIPKRPIERGVVGWPGIDGDGHNHPKHGGPLQAVSLLDLEDLEALQVEGYDVYPGAMGENLTVRGLSVDDLAVGDCLRFSGGVVIELTKKRKPCFTLDPIHPDLKIAVVGRCGYHSKVIVAGAIEVGETIEVVRAGARMAPSASAECRVPSVEH